MPWTHQGSNALPLPKMLLLPGVKGDHYGRPLAVSRRDHGLPYDQTGHDLQEDRRQANARLQGRPPLEVLKRRDR